MTRFVVMEPPSGDEAVLVRDRFHWLAFLLPLPWLLYHRLWLGSALYVAATGIVLALASLSGGGLAAQLAFMAPGLLVALEGPAWRIARLRRAGYREAGALQADSEGEADMILADAAPLALASTQAGWRARRDIRSLLDPIGH